MKREQFAEAAPLQLPVCGNRSDDSARLKIRLKEEISFLQLRLQQLGPEGDCGYEKALIRFFHEQIQRRHEQLADALD